jgi:esterase/lipase superfamily enzyme
MGAGPALRDAIDDLSRLPEDAWERQIALPLLNRYELPATFFVATGALESTKRFGSILAEKGIRHEVDLWGHDVPHDWPSWRRQIAHHLPRFL